MLGLPDSMDGIQAMSNRKRKTERTLIMAETEETVPAADSLVSEVLCGRVML
mgnify:CR=1 FL=1